MKTQQQAVPFKWPFPPKSRAQAPAGRAKAVARNKNLASPNRKAMLADVVMVIFWGASIPGLMWLGAASGF